MTKMAVVYEQQKEGAEMSDISAVKGPGVRCVRHLRRLAHQPDQRFYEMVGERGIKADWTALVDGWRAVYAASMDEVRKHPEHGYMILDTLHRQSLEKLVAQLSIKGLSRSRPASPDDGLASPARLARHRLPGWRA